MVKRLPNEIPINNFHSIWYKVVNKHQSWYDAIDVDAETKGEKETEKNNKNKDEIKQKK